MNLFQRPEEKVLNSNLVHCFSSSDQSKIEGLFINSRKDSHVTCTSFPLTLHGKHISLSFIAVEGESIVVIIQDISIYKQTEEILQLNNAEHH